MCLTVPGIPVGEVRPGKEIVVEGIPSYEEINEKGLGAWLAPAG